MDGRGLWVVRVVGGVVPRQEGEGNLGVLGGQSVLVLRLAALVPLAIVPNWPAAQPPKW